MKTAAKLSTAGFLFACALPACAGNTATNPVSSGGVTDAILSPNAPPAVDGVAGEFKGTVTDNVLGKGKAIFQLSQIVGGNAGGSMQLTFGKSATIASAVALDASSSKDIAGNAVALLANTPPCTLTITAKFDRKRYTLNGNYKAFNNCVAGQKGTFSAVERCYYVVAKPVANALRPRTLPKPC
jgi:hypothetical protein